MRQNAQSARYPETLTASRVPGIKNLLQGDKNLFLGVQQVVSSFLMGRLSRGPIVRRDHLSGAFPTRLTITVSRRAVVGAVVHSP